MKTQKAFTLIELLIVVAIIAILAAIAVPNFLEAQTRAKVSRAKSDMRSLTTAIESYAVDYNKYMPMAPPSSSAFGGPGDLFAGPSVFGQQGNTISARFIWLTTPIAYITSVFRDPFIPPNVGLALSPNGTPNPEYDTYDYVEGKTFSENGYIPLSSGGPIWKDSTAKRGSAICSGAGWHIVSAGPDRINAFGGGYAGQGFAELGVDYDPTNGTVSSGDVVRIGGGPGYEWSTGGALPAIDRVQNIYNDSSI